jgi:hypothetical protein
MEAHHKGTHERLVAASHTLQAITMLQKQA